MDKGREVKEKKVRFLADEEVLYLVEQCLHGVDERRRLYEGYLRDYLNNREQNMIYVFLNAVLSLIYYPDNVVFDIKGKYRFADAMAEELKTSFYRDGLDLWLYGVITLGLVLGSVIVKSVWRDGRVKHILVMPHNFGVLYEDMDEIDSRSQVVCEVAYLPYREAVWKFGEDVVQAGKIEGDKGLINGEGLLGIVLTKAKQAYLERPEITGEPNYEEILQPHTGDYVEVKELWVYDYHLEDWVVYQVIGSQVVRRFRNPYYKGILPYSNFTANDIPNYFWGRSEIYYLRNLQKKIDEYQRLFDESINLLKNPPILVNGQVAEEVADEIKQKLVTPGEIVPLPLVTGDIKPYESRLSPDIVLQIFQSYKNLFMETSGLSEILLGSSLKNVRSASHAQILANFASAPLKQKALRVEAFIERLMTTQAYYTMLNEPNLYDPDADFIVEVYAHTSSPITMIAYQDILFELTKAGLLPVDVLIDVLPIPQKDRIKQYIAMKEMMAMQQAVQQQQQPQTKKEKK